MRIPRIFTAQPLAPDATVALDEAAAHYVAKVLRMQPGRELVLFNGEGGEYTGSIESIDKRSVSVRITGHDDGDRQSPLEIHLGIGISRGERMDWVLQKATELGVTAITPLFTERCEVKLLGPRQEKKLQHWEQILVSSCEQCQRNRLPQLNPPQKLGDWIGSLPPSDGSDHVRFVLHHRSDQGIGQLPKPQSVTLVIGPEGGLSATEIDSCMNRDFRPLTLGPRVLRTETAPLAALTLVQYIWGDLS